MLKAALLQAVESNEEKPCLQMGVGAQKHAPDHPGKVPQVKDVVGLRGSGQEVACGILVHSLGSLHQYHPQPKKHRGLSSHELIMRQSSMNGVQ